MPSVEPRRCYFLAPTRDNPPDGLIRLGSIISIPGLADEPLNDVPVPINPDKIKIYQHTETNYSFSRDKKVNGSFGIWASFLMQILGIGGDMNVSAGQGDKDDWKCETLKTEWFLPTTEYVAQSLEHPNVKKYLVENKVWLMRSKLYMVTGLKIAYGASSTIEYANNRGINLHLGVDGTNSGIPGSLGPDGSFEIKNEATEKFEGADPFVFAFRLRQVRVRSMEEIDHRSYTNGAMLSLDDEGAGNDKLKIEILTEGAEDIDVGGEEFELNAWDATDDGGEIDGVVVCAKTE